MLIGIEMVNSISKPVSSPENKSTTVNPLVSIITPVLNGIKYLEICLQSVLNQSYPNIEHIFVDGGSTDGTLEMLASYQAKYPERIRFISGKDRGAEDAWNKGLKMGRGEIFGWLGADDTYEPDAISSVVEFVKINPDAYFVFGDINLIDEDGRVFGRTHCRDFDLKETLNDTTEIGAPSVFFRRKVLERVGFITTRTRISELDYWIRVGRVFQMHRIDKVLSNLRVHPGAFSGSPEAQEAIIRDGFFVSLKHGGSPFSPRARRYYSFLLSQLLQWLRPAIEGLRPILGWAYPAFNRVAQFFLRIMLGN